MKYKFHVVGNDRYKCYCDSYYSHPVNYTGICQIIEIREWLL